MKTLIIYLLVATLLVQIGCSSISQITLPIETNQNDNELKSLNYFGEKLNSIIRLTNSIEVEAYWLKLKDDKIYFLTNGLDDTSSVGIDKINTVRFYDGYGGCMKGAWLGLGLILLEGIATEVFVPKGVHQQGAGYAILVLAPITMLLSTAYGISFLGEREFKFVQN